MLTYEDIEKAKQMLVDTPWPEDIPMMFVISESPEAEIWKNEFLANWIMPENGDKNEKR